MSSSPDTFSFRIAGYRSGSIVTLLGKRASGGKMVVDRVFGGTPDEYVIYLRKYFFDQIIIILLITSIGIGYLVIGIWILLKK